MITTGQITEILSLYKKHGWNLCRVLLSAELQKTLNDEEIKAIFGNVEIIKSEINAVWFSRPSKHSKIAWELRHLSETPYAFFELFDKDEDEDFQAEKQKEMENRLKDYASNKTGNKK